MSTPTSTPKTVIRRVSCPTCQKQVEWTEANEHRPFCSERCKLIDFGEWAQERHAIAGQPVMPELDDDEYSD